MDNTPSFAERIKAFKVAAETVMVEAQRMEAAEQRLPSVAIATRTSESPGPPALPTIISILPWALTRDEVLRLGSVRRARARSPPGAACTITASA